MGTFHVVRRQAGPAWLAGRPMEEQTGWAAHAAFMDALVDEGTIVLGGPLTDDGRVAIAFEAASVAAVEAILGRDPWTGSHLLTVSIEPWTIRLDGRRR